jgi:hypothetical protein
MSRFVASNIKSIGARSFATNVSWTDMAQSKSAFVNFVNSAVANKSGPEAGEMYQYLTKCFVDNDSDYDGLVSYKGFNNMIHESALAPRRFGFAPHTREMYASQEEFESERKALFNQLSGGEERIPFEAWIGWSQAHIVTKATQLEVHADARWERSSADFVSFFQGVVAESSSNCKRSSSSTQFKEYYMLLNQHFVAADANNAGFVDAAGFPELVAQSHAIAHRFGYDWYSGVSFNDVAVAGKVTFKGWLDFSLKLVAEKVAAF